jgi:hypothetical protein
VDVHPAHYLDLNLVCGVPGLQGTGIDPYAHLERHSEPIGGVNCSALHKVTLKLLIDSYVSRFFSSVITKKIYYFITVTLNSGT